MKIILSWFTAVFILMLIFIIAAAVGWAAIWLSIKLKLLDEHTDPIQVKLVFFCAAGSAMLLCGWKFFRYIWVFNKTEKLRKSRE